MAKPSQPQQPGVSATRGTPGLLTSKDDPEEIAATIGQWTMYSSATDVLRSLRDRMSALLFRGYRARRAQPPAAVAHDGFAIFRSLRRSCLNRNSHCNWSHLAFARTGSFHGWSFLQLVVHLAPRMETSVSKTRKLRCDALRLSSRVFRSICSWFCCPGVVG